MMRTTQNQPLRNIKQQITPTHWSRGKIGVLKMIFQMNPLELNLLVSTNNPYGPLDNISALAQIIARGRTGE